MAEPSDDEIDAQFLEMAKQEILKDDPIWQTFVGIAANAIRECFNYLDAIGFEDVGSFVIGTINLGNIKDGPALAMYRVVRADKNGRFDYDDESSS